MQAVQHFRCCMAGTLLDATLLLPELTVAQVSKCFTYMTCMQMKVNIGSGFTLRFFTVVSLYSYWHFQVRSLKKGFSQTGLHFILPRVKKILKMVCWMVCMDLMHWIFGVAQCYRTFSSFALVGYETARSLALHGATVVMACRNLQSAHACQAAILKEQSKAKVEVIHLDLARLKSVREFAEAYKRTGWSATLCQVFVFVLPNICLNNRPFSFYFIENEVRHDKALVFSSNALKCK